MNELGEETGRHNLEDAVPRWMVAPVYAGEPETTRVTKLLKMVILGSAVLTALLLVGAFSGDNIPAMAKIIGMAWLAILLLGWWMMRQGQIHFVANALTLLFFVAITAITASLGTIRAPVAAVYVFWVILAGMLFHRPGMLVGTAVSSAAIAALIWAENAGWLPQPDYSVGLTQWLNFTVLFMITSAMVYYGNRNIEKALATATDEIEKRKQTEIELHKLTRAVEQSPASIIITDLNGSIQYVNPRFTAVTGYTADEAIGKNPSLLKSGTTPTQVYKDLWRTLVRGGEWRGEFVNRKKDGTLYHESVVISPITNRDGVVSHYLAVREDISERKQSEEALRVSESRHRLLADNARDVIWTMTPRGQITYISPSVEKVRGLTAAEAMAQTVDQIHPPDSQAVALAYFAQLSADLAAGRTAQSFKGQLEYCCKDGSTLWTEVMAHPVVSEGRLLEIIGVTRDISEHKRLVTELQQAKEATEKANQALLVANAELAKIATTDPLTGAWNRRHFLDVAEQMRAQARRYKTNLSLLILDIDHFKPINDQHGHQIGDQVLMELTRLIKSELREADIFARWGGEEFVLLVPHCHAMEAVQMAEKLRLCVAAHPFAAIGSLTISIGAAELQFNESIDSLFKRGDVALYAAKAAGRNTVRLCPSDGPDRNKLDLNHIAVI